MTTKTTACRGRPDGCAPMYTASMNWTYWSCWGGMPPHNLPPIFRSDPHRPPNVQRWKDGVWVDEPYMRNYVEDELERGSGTVWQITPEEVAAFDPRALADEA